MLTVNSPKRNWLWLLGFMSGLAVPVACYLMVKLFPASALSAQIGLGFLFLGSVIGFVQLFTVTVPWFIQANRRQVQPAPPSP